MTAARAEADSLAARWERFVDGEGTASLNLQALLRSQERVTETENELVNAQLTYNLALANLRRSNGTLLQVEGIEIGRIHENGIPRIVLDKQNTDRPSQPAGEIAPSELGANADTNAHKKIVEFANLPTTSRR